MYRILYITGILLMVQLASAQRYEVGVFLGGSNPISDVGSTYYVYPNQVAFGGLFKWNFHQRMALRVQVNKSSLKGDDAQSDIPGKINRQFSFKSDLTELSVGAEFNFFRFRIKNLYFEKAVTPPVEATDTTKRTLSYTFPVIFGVKKKITMRLILAGEVGFRYTLTNNLDGSLPKERPFSFGNKASNDWYTFTGLTLTYTFGEEPCYCRK